MSLKHSLLGLKPRVEPLQIQDITYYVRVMSGSERFVFEKLAGDPKADNNGLVEIAFLCLCDEKGKRLFDQESDKRDIEQLPADILYTIFHAALKMNKILGVDATDEVKH
jgi:hypothetical protein